MANPKPIKVIEQFPPNVPPALVNEYRRVIMHEHGSMRILAVKLGVNIKYLSDLLARGIEPTDKTVKGRAVREKLFLKNRTALQSKEEVIEALESIVKHLQQTIERLKR